MLQGFAIGLLGFFLQLFGQPSSQIPSMPLVAWQNAEIFSLPTQPDSTVEAMVNDYLGKLSRQGLNPNQQGIWMQSEWAELANHRSDIKGSAASLTKIATTLAVLETFGPSHRFETRVYTTGKVENGVLNGDLVIEGTGDPLFVWEEAIAFGNALNQLGITQVKGNLIITGNFTMNFKSDPQVAGTLLKRGLNAGKWSSVVLEQYKNMPPDTPKPEVAIAGEVQVSANVPEGAKLVIKHQSLTVTELLKQMNIYSNNAMAEMFAQSVGGAEKVRQIVLNSTKISADEIHLINGSGLGVDNRISPHAVTEMLMTIEEKFAPQSVHVVDLFPVAGRDKTGTMKFRNLPEGVAIKTGTLAQVSNLAGVIPTKERGLVWFSILNYGSSNIEKLRAEQDELLQSLSKHWEIIPGSMTPTADQVFLGDPSRNVKVNG